MTVQSSDTTAQVIKHGADGILGLGALSVPLWIENVTGWVAVLTAFLGLALVTVRVLIAIREYRYKRRTMKL